MTLRVLLADDHALLRATFRILIDSCDDMEVVAEATNGGEAVALARVHRPDLALMDIRLPGTDGVAATSAICSDPDLSGTRVLILTTFEIDEYVAQALQAGASGFLGKDVTADAFLDGIRTVAAGDSLLSPLATRALITRFLAAPAQKERPMASADLSALTTPEREVMGWVAEGHSNEEIAEKLSVSPPTVRTQVHRTMTKLGARDRAQLVVIAHQSGLTTVSPPADRCPLTTDI
ncbi:response regulator transcription factor [Streptomyces sp. NBC_00201]|uniref:response regulator n=1 Tax=unclassified Streptomyces TaxID=2593676 RepID=UPI002254401F|nr:MULTISPECIES: response regulator transcription factor [unclassified Streptomyces]MCX5064092.1 response regulator transcription factor [Streptomyces sp. NBC_00452]MCX5251513.1 response regulator transcription factor [Streptomyces sp. NBC_00201]MCX5294563.1 response regulator transcription factor [Streptomyces sp. NBC_00183]